jgi:riboflavin kinase/FMN adenylyltransferase
VVTGKSRGKILGFPTANIETRNEIVPDGIYITTTRVGREVFPSLTNVGSRPTFGERETSVESYIIDFSRNLYGKKIRINFIKKLRDERKFKAEDDLTRQIKKDLEAARKYFKLKSK